MVLTMKKRWMLAALLFACALLTACGSADVEPEGELSLVDEQGEEVTLTNKERATILFHFTEVGWGLCQQQLVQLQENLELFEGIDADLYAISTDTPANSKSLKEAGAFTFTFLSDQSFEVLEHVNMRNDQMSYRGVSILDKNGNYVFHQVNDHWGEQIEVVASIVVDEFEKMNK